MVDLTAIQDPRENREDDPVLDIKDDMVFPS